MLDEAHVAKRALASDGLNLRGKAAEKASFCDSQLVRSRMSMCIECWMRLKDPDLYDLVLLSFRCLVTGESQVPVAA